MGGLNKIYFNHIPKTGGMSVTWAIKDALKQIDFEYKSYTMGDRGNVNYNTMLSADLILGHLGIEPNICIDNLLTFTVIRNPIDRLISNYLMIYEDQKISSIDHFNNWIFNDDIGYLTKNNLQSRFLTTTRKEDSERDFFYNVTGNDHKQTMKAHFFIQENGFGIKNEKINYNLAKKYLNECSLVMTTENLYNEMEKVINLINNKWNLKAYTVNPPPRDTRSNRFKKLLNKKQINKIINLNSIDMEIWKYAKTLS